MTLFRKFRPAPYRRLYLRPAFKFRQRKPRSTRGIHKKEASHYRGLADIKGKIVEPGAGVRPARPRPVGKHWKNKPDVWLPDGPGGREICNPATPGGRAEYKSRIRTMWLRQRGRCCNCPYELSLDQATFEHEVPRTKGRQDDRIAIFDEAGNLVRLINGASHEHCNSARGSRRTPIWHGEVA